MPTPRAFSSRMMRKSSAISASFSAEVGSSMIRTRESKDKALAISTICCLATVSVPTVARGIELQVHAAKKLAPPGG
jgi:hypothetical protein